MTYNEYHETAPSVTTPGGIVTDSQFPVEPRDASSVSIDHERFVATALLRRDGDR